jgi:hypothetical protein
LSAVAGAEHWRRDAPTFYNFLALDRSIADRPDVLGGIAGALMSRDLASRAETHFLDIAPGWNGRTDSREASLEFFVLSGTLSLGAETVGAGGYVHLPQGCGGEELSSRTGARALAFWNPNLPSFPYPYTRRRLLHTHETGWINSVPGAHGVMHKSLRLPDPTPETPESGFDGGPGGYLRFQFIAPEMIAEGEHVHHECWEEIILLQGDVLLVNEGQMAKGSVVSHPQEWYHAPFTSRGGALILVHTDAPMGFPWPPREYPGAMDLCSRYLEQSPFDRELGHVDWADHPLAAIQEENPDYRRWRESGAGPLWGDADPGEDIPWRPGGRGTASDFRASWSRRCCE